jgi:hypothetical protein
MKQVINNNGITLKELKQLISDLPESDMSGNEYEVWLQSGTGITSICKAIVPLNNHSGGSDIALFYNGIE